MLFRDRMLGGVSSLALMAPDGVDGGGGGDDRHTDVVLQDLAAAAFDTAAEAADTADDGAGTAPARAAEKGAGELKPAATAKDAPRPRKPLLSGLPARIAATDAAPTANLPAKRRPSSPPRPPAPVPRRNPPARTGRALRIPRPVMPARPRRRRRPPGRRRPRPPGKSCPTRCAPISPSASKRSRAALSNTRA
jgi:hypothetical protein